MDFLQKPVRILSRAGYLYHRPQHERVEPGREQKICKMAKCLV